MRRRQVLMTAGSLTLAGNAITTVSGETGKNELTEEEVVNLLKEGKKDELEERGAVVESFDAEPVNPPSDESSDGVELQKAYPENGSEFHISTWEDDGKPAMTAQMIFPDNLVDKLGSTRFADDIVGCVFNGDEYDLEEPPSLQVDSDEGVWSIETDNYDPNDSGVAARVDNARYRDGIWGLKYPESPIVTMTVKLDPKPDSSYPPVFWEYSQNFAGSFTGGVKSVSLAPPTGGIELELAVGANTAWEAPGWGTPGELDL